VDLVNARTLATELRDKLLNGGCVHGGNFLALSYCEDCELAEIEAARDASHQQGVTDGRREALDLERRRS
jgi:hypothetical protein